jgi:hypothetical protein
MITMKDKKTKEEKNRETRPEEPWYFTHMYIDGERIVIARKRI